MQRQGIFSIVWALILFCLLAGQARADVNDLIWSTYLGGSSYDLGYGVTHDEDGHIYVVGQTGSTNFPTTSGAYDTTLGGADAFVVKLNAGGTSLIYATYLGGSSFEEGFDIAVDSSHRAYVTGATMSSDFPTIYGSYDTTYNGLWDAFIVQINASGTDLELATYFGGTSDDQGRSITLDNLENILITGATDSPDFPTTDEAADTTFANGEAFVAKLNAAGSALLYSTYLGGGEVDNGSDIIADDFGSAYVTGYTNSSDFPITSSAYDTSHNVGYDVFVTKLNAAGSDVIYSTYLGASEDEYGWAIALDDSGQVHVAGETYSRYFPLSASAYDTTFDNGEVFVAKFDSSCSHLRYSTYLGGDQHDYGRGIGLDSSQRAWVIGETDSPNFPISIGAYDPTPNGLDDVFITALSVSGDSLYYSTFLGGEDLESGRDISIDASDNIYLTGWTSSTHFPTIPGVFDTTVSDIDGFAARINLAGGDATPPDSIDDLAIALEDNPKEKGLQVRLRWSMPFDDVGVVRYVIYRSTSATDLGDSLAGTADTTYLDIGAIGDVDTNYCYAIKAVDAAENKSGPSNRVGEYDWALEATPRTDYTWICVPLYLDSLLMASDLEAHIEAHSSPSADCYKVSKWNAIGQSYSTYITDPIPLNDFPIQPGGAYRVEVSNDATWTLVGAVWPADSLTFQLEATPRTDYTWISVPLHLDSLLMASDLEAHIEAHSSPSADCYKVSKWNAVGQSYSTYINDPIPLNDFPIQPGGAYRVEVSNDATWPASLKDEERINSR